MHTGFVWLYVICRRSLAPVSFCFSSQLICMKFYRSASPSALQSCSNLLDFNTTRSYFCALRFEKLRFLTFRRQNFTDQSFHRATFWVSSLVLSPVFFPSKVCCSKNPQVHLCLVLDTFTTLF